jgi:ABC-type glycerol-3-phosphate transport system substrate-binding protein
VNDAQPLVDSGEEPEVVSEEPLDDPVVVNDDEVVTIRFQDWRLAEEPAATALGIIIAEFEAAYPNIHVQLEPVSQSDRVEKFNNQFRAGDPPDVVRFNVTELPTEISMGAFEPLNQYLEAEGGVDEFFSDFSAALVGPATMDGIVYAIPHEGDSFLLYVNKGRWEAVGLDPVNNPPQTFEELREANLLLTDAENNQYAFGMWPVNMWMQSWYHAFGARYFNDDYTETYIDSPEGIEAFKFYIEMYTKDNVVPPGATEVGYGDQVAIMAQGQVAYIQGPYATWGGILEANPDLTDELISIPFPGTGATAGRGTHFSIGAGSAHPAEAWELIKWLTSAEQMYSFFVNGSMLPTRYSALEMIDLEQYPGAKAMVEQAIPKTADTYPAFPEWGQCSQIFNDAIIAALLGQGEPEDIIREAADEIRVILADRQ